MNPIISKRIRKYLPPTIGLLATVTAGLFFSCTFVIPALKSQPKELFTDNSGAEFSLAKATIADACDSKTKECLKNVFLISGNFDDSTVEALNRLGDRTARTICFRSNGGRNDTAKALMKIIKEEKLNTCLADEYHLANGTVLKNTMCHSACPLVLVSGYERINLGKNIQVGIHHSGQSIDLCIMCWRLSYGGGDFESDIKDTPDAEQHLALFYRSRKTPTRELDLLAPDDWVTYKVFNKWL